MSCNSNADASKRKTSNASYVEPATLWEHFVLQKATEKKLQLFNLEIPDRKPKDKSKDKLNIITGKMASALDAATAFVMKEQHRQRSVSAPAPAPASIDGILATSSKSNATSNEAKLPPTLLASISAANSLSSSTFNSSTSTSPSYPTGSERIFGSTQEASLTLETLGDDAERQENLIRTTQTEGLTMANRLKAEQQFEPRNSREVTMRGALEAGDWRCEVCAARERAMGGLEEAGIVAL